MSHPSTPHENPYANQNLSISYDVKDLLERIEHKLDKSVSLHEQRLTLLEKNPPITNGEIRMAHVEGVSKEHEARIVTLEKESENRKGSSWMAEKAMRTIIFIATLASVISGIVIGVIGLLI